MIRPLRGIPSILLAAGIVLPFTLACAGGGGDTIVRIDYSHVDGQSCLVGGGRPRIAWNEGDWDLSSCGTRATDLDDVSGPCRAALNTECCDQIGAEFVGWQSFSLSGEKLIGPLCKLP